MKGIETLRMSIHANSVADIRFRPAQSEVGDQWLKDVTVMGEENSMPSMLGRMATQPRRGPFDKHKHSISDERGGQESQFDRGAAFPRMKDLYLTLPYPGKPRKQGRES